MTVAHHILVIEDSPLVQRLVSVCLRGLDQEIRVAEDGPSGLAAALADPPALVVLDIGLPGMDGWEVLSRLRGDGRFESIPVLVLTAHAQAESRRLADHHGASDFMTKPFEPPDLRAAVSRLLTATPAPNVG